MKIKPLAANHIILELDNGELIAINDATSVSRNNQGITDCVHIIHQIPSRRRMHTRTNATTYDGSTDLIFPKKEK